MWTEERVALLQRLWGQGYSASQIASQLEGVSRNAVIGKIHRLGKQTGPKAPRPRRPFAATTARRRSASEVRRAPAPADWGAPPRHRSVFAEAPGLATCTTLKAHMCRWPIGDPDDAGFSFCGQPAEGSRPYCQGHARLAYKRAPGGGPEAEINRLCARYS
jgi:GcrA cell cycle regulator